jgi:4-nitrophenyl phosphatase
MVSINTGFLIDLDGTLYRGGQMIPHADEFILFLQKNQFPYLFVTNNSTRTPQAVAEHLTSMGINADADHVLTTAQAAAIHIRNVEADRTDKIRIFLVGEIGLIEAFNDDKFEISLTADDPVDYVIQGKDNTLSYGKLTDAVNLIRGGAQFILTNPDLILPMENGIIPGAGSIAAMISAASQVKPVIIGKPSKIIMDIALDRLELSNHQVYVVGDNPMTDILAGQTAGCKTVLVLTGLATADNITELTAASNCSPDEVYPSLAELQQKLLSLL